MLCEKLVNMPFTNCLTDGPLQFIPSFRDRKAWESIAPEKKASLLAVAEKLHSEPYAFRSASGMLQMMRFGDRMQDEGPYFQRRRKLCMAVMNVCITGSLDSLDEVIDGFWCILEESTWVLSAHMEEILPDPEHPHIIELFSAQTAMNLTLCCQALEAQIKDAAPGLWERIAREMEERILTPFETRNDFWWMGYVRKNLNNWTPWILSGLMPAICFWIQDKDRIARLLTRACEMLDRYLICVPEDVGCDEGPMYWNMAGGALLDCLETLEKVTGGQLTWWQESKIRNFLQYPALMNLGNGWFANFADGDARPHIDGERLRTAGRKTQNDFLLSAGNALRDDASRFATGMMMMNRLIFWTFEPPVNSNDIPALPENVFLPNVQIRLLRKNNAVLCCKGGHNDESHNHNDVGSFILYLDREPEIIDAGTLTYTGKTFSHERYQLWYTRSAYHNVPRIGEYEQAAGRSFQADAFTRLENGAVIQFASAYPQEAGVQKLQRTFCMEENGSVSLTDEIALHKAQSVAWTFLLRNQPHKTESGFSTEKLKTVLPSNCSLEIEEIPITDARMGRNFPGSIWRVIVSSPCSELQKSVFQFKQIQASGGKSCHSK